MTGKLVEGRHPSTEHMLKMLEANPNLKGDPAYIARQFEEFAQEMASFVEDSLELTAGLRHLLEAKDCLVRSVVFFKNETPVSYTDR